MNPRPLTPRAQKSILDANEFAKECNHQYVGSEHLLMGLIRLKDGLAFRMMAAHGITEDSIRTWLTKEGWITTAGDGTPESEIKNLKERVANLERVIRGMVAPTPDAEGNPS